MNFKMKPKLQQDIWLTHAEETSKLTIVLIIFTYYKEFLWRCDINIKFPVILISFVSFPQFNETNNNFELISIKLL